MIDKIIDDGGPAFPAMGKQVRIGDREIVQPSSDGMTLRDWFAGKALEAQLSIQDTHGALAAGKFSEQELAQVCYGYADAMLAARKEGK